MDKLNKISTQVSSTIHSDKARLIVLVLTIALFMLSAGAPSATIGIGK